MKVLVLPPWLTGRSEPWLPSCLCCNPAAAVECMQHTRTQTSWAPEEVDSINSGPSCPMRARRPSLPPQLLAQQIFLFANWRIVRGSCHLCWVRSLDAALLKVPHAWPCQPHGSRLFQSVQANPRATQGFRQDFLEPF